MLAPVGTAQGSKENCASKHRRRCLAGRLEKHFAEADALPDRFNPLSSLSVHQTWLDGSPASRICVFCSPLSVHIAMW